MLYAIIRGRMLCAVFLAFGFVALFSANAVAQGDQSWAKNRVDNSRRHLEWVDVKHGDRTVKCFIAYPEVWATKTQAVIVIHEIFGLTEWVKSICDQLAEAGYIAIAPDFLSGMGPNGGGSAELGAEVRNVMNRLPADQITADLNAAAEYVQAAVGEREPVSVWLLLGRYANVSVCNEQQKPEGGVCFLRSGPTDADEIAKINCPVYGFYGERDTRINATIDSSKKLMADAKKTYETVIYAGPATASCGAEKTRVARPQIKRAVRMGGCVGRNFSRSRRR